MTDQPSAVLESLSPEEQGCLLGMNLLGLTEAALARLSADGKLCHAAWGELQGLERSVRAEVLAKWMAEISAPFSPGMDRLHPTWIAEVVADEPRDLWPMLIPGLPGAHIVAALLEYRADNQDQLWPPELVREFQRCVLARLEPLCVGPSGPLGAVLCRLSCEELLAEVIRRGPALQREIACEGDASRWAIAGRLPATLGRRWVKW